MKTPLIYAHRGASGEYTEMTRKAYEAAISQSADGFECDVRLSKDNELILWHDDDMTRVANCELAIASSTKEELLKQFPIMTASELLDLAIEYKKDIAYETKHPVPTRGAVEKSLIQLLESRRKEIESAGIGISIMSFSWWATRKIQRSPWPAVSLVWNKRGVVFSSTPIIALEVDQVRKDSQLVRRLQSRGKRVYVWTVNSPEDARLMRDSSVDVIISDFPSMIRKALE